MKTTLSNPALKGKRIHIITPYGKHYFVNSKGEITYPGYETPSGGWLFEGVVPTNGSSSFFLRFEDLSVESVEAMDFLYKNGNPRFTVRDRDHGTTRIWGNTKYHGIKYMYIEDSK